MGGKKPRLRICLADHGMFWESRSSSRCVFLCCILLSYFDTAYVQSTADRFCNCRVMIACEGTNTPLHVLPEKCCCSFWSRSAVRSSSAVCRLPPSSSETVEAQKIGYLGAMPIPRDLLHHVDALNIQCEVLRHARTPSTRSNNLPEVRIQQPAFGFEGLVPL